MRIVLDLQGCQSASRLRGIGRYSMALAKAIVRNAGDHEVWIVLNELFPDTIEEIRQTFSGLLPQDRIAVFSVPMLTPYQGEHDWRTRAAILVREYAIGELEPDLVHVSSLFEGYVDHSLTSVKELDSDVLTAVTLYDLIPYLNPDRYLTDAGFKRHYLKKIDALKRADVLLAISEYCGEEASRELGIAGEKITNISSAVSDSFRTIELTDEQRGDLCARYRLTKPFVMTTGIVEPRKNLEGLIVAYSKLPIQVRREHQLFMVCQATESNSAKLRSLAQANGLNADELVLASFVSDHDLVALYNTCRLFVFPSLHEGFGLPALEAMACGAAVIGSNATSIPEVIGRDDALFDPRDIAQMASTMQRALSDEAFWRSLREHAGQRAGLFSWDETGRRALRAFEAAYAKRSSPRDAAVTDDAGVAADVKHAGSEARYLHLIDALRKLNPAMASERDYIATADAIAANQRGTRARQLFVDVSVLCEVDAKSGIQRVTRAILRQLLIGPPSGWQVRPVRLDRTVMAYRYANHFLRELDLGSHVVEQEDDWLDSQQGDAFLGLDLVADCVPPAQQWFERQRRRGIKVYFVVYDLLPVTRPDWFPEVIAQCFPLWLQTIATVSDGLIGISRSVADDIKVWLDAAKVERKRDLKLGYFHLGADIESSQPSRGLADDTPQVLAALQARPTILMVGTVEPRKGHVQAFAAFEKLWADGIDVNLAIVGKAGWRLNGFDDTLKRHPERSKRFFWLEGVTDEYLEKVYEVASCLLIASKGEGFGLPLIEAAQKGVPVIARDIPVFREVAGDYAFYFDGDDADTLARALRNWLDLHADGRAPSSVGMPWLTWQQSAEQIKNVIFDGAWHNEWRPAALEGAG